MVIYSIFLFLFAVLFMGTMPYKRRTRKRLDRKMHKLWMFYGMAMFLIDRVPQKRRQENVTINRAMQQMYVKEDIHKERYLYFTEKVSMSLLVFLLALGFGLGVSITEMKEKNTEIKQLQRQELLEQEYDVVAQKEGGEQEEVHLIVGERIRSEKEIQQILKSNQKNLIQEFLGENQDLNHITEDVDLVPVLGKEKILVTWDVGKDNPIDLEGKIQGDIEEKGVPVQFIATMSLEEVSRQVVIKGTVFPKKGKRRLEQQIQKKMDVVGGTKKAVDLPEKVDGKKMKYYLKTTPIGKMIFPVGIAIAIAMFFLKDRELKTKIGERKNQMESDYSELVGKIVLFYQAGLSFSSTVEKIISEYKEEKRKNKEYYRYAYEELEIARAKMQSGISEIQALTEFGERCGMQNYMRLATIIEQNLRRGTKELVIALQGEQREALEERKNLALRKGSEISTKLLGPMIIMLVVTMTIVVVPSFLSMNLN